MPWAWSGGFPRNGPIMDAVAQSAPTSGRATSPAAWAAFPRALRVALQSAVLAVGAYLVIKRSRATAGIIIAGSILSARACAGGGR